MAKLMDSGERPIIAEPSRFDDITREELNRPAGAADAMLQEMKRKITDALRHGQRGGTLNGR